METRNALRDLFEGWMNKPNHADKLFNKDGIVDIDTWDKENKKILFIFKESWHKKEITDYYDLAEDLYENGGSPWGMWNRVAEWVYVLQNTNSDNLASYINLDNHEKHELLKKIAVLNLKKSGGESISNDDNLQEYASDDWEEIKKQIDIIKPNIIVCGYTFKFIKGMLIEENTPSNPNWFYWNTKGQLILDYYHPANQFPSLLNFYGIASIYYHALKAKPLELQRASL